MIEKLGKDWEGISDLELWRETEIDENMYAVLNDFKNFLYVVAMQEFGIPPTRVQYDIGDYLQYGPHRSIVQAFRGVGKSYVTVSYAAWILLRYGYSINILVVSATKDFATQFTTGLKRTIASLDFCGHLLPDEECRNSVKSFDVPGNVGKDPNVKSEGILGQITGTRADLIIADDVETSQNTESIAKREKLHNAVKEFSFILKPKPRPEEIRPDPKIVYLGTPHNEESLYNELEGRGYKTRVWTGRYPNAKIEANLGEKLAPMIKFDMQKDPSIMTGYGLNKEFGAVVDTERFDEDKMIDAEMEGRSHFLMQMYLDTTLNDLDRFPLKLKELVVMDLDKVQGPGKVIRSRDPENIIEDLECVGFTHDRYFRPAVVSKDFYNYEQIYMAVDPSGGGKDETAVAVVAALHGMLFVLHIEGISGPGSSPRTIQRIVEIAKEFKVNKCIVESNLGAGAYSEILRRELRQKAMNLAIEDVHVSKQKELRIIAALEPFMNQGRLIIDRKVIEKDFYEYDSELGHDEVRVKRLFHQMSRITKDKGCLDHDDRLDALSLAVSQMSIWLGTDVSEALEDHRDDLEEQDWRTEVGMELVDSYGGYDGDDGSFGMGSMDDYGY